MNKTELLARIEILKKTSDVMLQNDIEHSNKHEKELTGKKELEYTDIFRRGFLKGCECVWGFISEELEKLKKDLR